MIKKMKRLFSNDSPDQAESSNHCADAAIDDLDGSELEDKLESMYWDEGMSLTDIGDELGFSAGWVSGKMSELGISTRDPSVTQRIKNHGITDESPELEYLDWLTPTQQQDIRAILINEKSCAEQARDRGVAHNTVSANISRGIKRLKKIRDQEVDK